MGKLIVGVLILALVFGGGWFAGVGAWVSNAAGDVVDGISDAVGDAERQAEQRRDDRGYAQDGYAECPGGYTERLDWKTGLPVPGTRRCH